MKVSIERLRLEFRRARAPLNWLILLYLLAAAAAIATLARQQFISPFTDHELVEVAVDNAAGVVAGKTEVRVAGVQVGLVQNVSLVGTQPRLTLAINPDVGPIYRDAAAELAAVTPLQDMYVELDPGHRSSGPLSPALISSAQSSVAVNIADVLDAFNAEQRQRLTTVLDALSRGLPGGGIKLREAFAELVPLMRDSVQITDEIDSQHQQLATAVHNLGQITLLLAKHDTQLAGLVQNGSEVLATLAGNDQPLDATLRALPGSVAALHSGLGEVAGTIGSINPALHELQPAARTLAPALKSLTSFARQAQPALTALSPAADKLIPLSAALAEFASATRRTATVLTPEVPTIDNLTATIVKCVFPIQAFVDRFISANKLGNSKGTWWRVQIVANGDSGSPIKTCVGGSPSR